MIIVSNTSPITNLAAIDQLNLLHQIYDRIIIPQAVYDELTQVGYPVPGSLEVQTLPWIQTQQVQDPAPVLQFQQDVDPGESEAIALALELNADQLLIDDAAGRALAEQQGLNVTGLLGVLLVAKQRSLISSVTPLLNDLMTQAGFRVSSALYERVLKIARE